VLKYRVVGGLQVNGQNTQVFWKAIWADRKSPIAASQVTVKLPDVLAGKVSSYNSLGIPTTVRQIDGKTFVFTAKQALPPQQELEVQITFPTGILKLSPPSGQGSSGSGVIRDGSSEVGGFLGFILWAIVLLVITSPVWISVLLFITLFWLYRRSRKLCFSCKKLTLIRTTKVISTPTPRAKGKKKIIRHCENCGYHHEKIVVTTYTYPSSSSHSGSYGGSSDSGSYGGGGDSGGGGGGGGGGDAGGGGGGG